MKMATKANYVLLLVAAVWGASYPIARAAVQDLSPAVFVAVRFALATVLLAPWVWGKWRDGQALRLGLILGLIEGTVCALLAMNISHMPASRCAFIMGSSVIMVPFWAALLRLQKLTLLSAVRTMVSLIGLYYLTGARLSAMGEHEFGVLAAAALWALNIVILKRQTMRYRVSPQVVAFYQSAANCVVPVIVLVARPAPLGMFSPTAIVGLLFCAIFATAMNLFLQTKYQRYTSASQAALRLSLEPLFASVVAVMFFGDMLTATMALGAGIMMVATLMPELLQVGSALLARLRPDGVRES